MWGCRWALVNWLHPGWLLFEPTALLNCCGALGELPPPHYLQPITWASAVSAHSSWKAHQSWPSSPGPWPPVTYGFTHNIWVQTYMQEVYSHEVGNPGIHLNPSCGAWLSWPLLMVEILIFSSPKATSVWPIFLSGCRVYKSARLSVNLLLWRFRFVQKIFFLGEHKLTNVTNTISYLNCFKHW